MDTKTALGAAAGLTLTMAGGVSALFLTTGLLEPSGPAPEPTAVVVEYVDQNGNPVEAPTTPAATTPEVVFVYPDETQAAADAQIETAAPLLEAEQPLYEEYEDAEYEEAEYEEAEYEGEHEEGDLEEGEEYDDD